MSNVNREIILESCRRLSDSTRTNWTKAGLEEWVSYAKKMKNAIENITPILLKVANSIENEPNPENEEIRVTISRLAAELTKEDLIYILKGNVKIEL